MFFYGKKSIDINFFYQSFEDMFSNILEELDSKKHKRGFFLYALEIMKAGKDFKVLKTNLQPFFEEKLKILFDKIKKSSP